MHHFETFGAIFFFNFLNILFADSAIFTDFFSDNLMIEITYFIINYFIKSFDLMGQVLLSSLTNTGSSGKLFLNFLPIRNISPDFFSVYLFVTDKPFFSESIYVRLSLFYYSNAYNVFLHCYCHAKFPGVYCHLRSRF